MKIGMYNKKSIAKENIFSDNGKLVNLNGVETYVIEMGEGESIIFVNGIAVTSYTWRGVIKTLKDKFHIFAMDFKGFGQSEKNGGEYSVEIYTEQIKSLIKHYNITKATLVGSSLGGRIALNFTLKFPEKINRLVLLDSAGYQKNKKILSFLIRLFRYEIFREVFKMSLTKYIVKIFIKWAFENEKVIDEEIVEAYFNPLNEKGGIEALSSLIKSLSYSDLNYEAIKSINIPTLIIWGDKDKWLPKSDAYRFHKDIKNSKLIVLKDCGHGPHEEYPEVVSNLVENFMKS
jgi:pimeloyl-ACP methyl ester carboxylesterase